MKIIHLPLCTLEDIHYSFRAICQFIRGPFSLQYPSDGVLNSDPNSHNCCWRFGQRRHPEKGHVRMMVLFGSGENDDLREWNSKFKIVSDHMLRYFFSNWMLLTLGSGTTLGPWCTYLQLIRELVHQSCGILIVWFIEERPSSVCNCMAENRSKESRFSLGSKRASFENISFNLWFISELYYNQGH